MGFNFFALEKLGARKMETDNRPLPERLRQLAKWYNLSDPYIHDLLLEAISEIESETAWACDYSEQVEKLTHENEKLRKELDGLYEDMAGESI
jgi:hypothetical protein